MGYFSDAFLKNIKRFFIISVIQFWLVPFSFAQQKQVLFNHLTENNGLPTNDVTGNVLEDSYGFMWFCSGEGLCRYDGGNIKVFQNERNNPNSLSSNNVISICETLDKRLLIATSEGLCIYNMLTESFSTLYPNSEKPNDGPLRLHIDDVIPEKNNRFWIVYLNDFSLLDLNTGKFRHFSRQDGFDQKFEALNIFKIYRGQDDNFYLAVENDHIYKWENEKWEKMLIQTGSDFSLFVDKHGLLLLGDKDFSVMDAGLNFDAPVSAWNFTQSKIVSIEQDFYGNIWAASANDGLFIISPRTKQVLQHFSDKTSPFIPSNQIERIFILEKHLFVLLAKGSGLLHYQPLSNSFVHYKHNPTDANSISPLTSKYTTLNIDKSGVIWVKPEINGIDFFDLEQSKFSILRNKITDPYPIQGAINRGVYASNKTSIWLGNDKAIYRYDRTNQSFVTFPHSLINTIYAKDENDIWIGGSQLINYRYNNGSLIKKKEFKSVESDKTSLSHWYVNYINKTRDGKLWVCTAGGFGELVDNAADGGNGIFRNYFYDPNNTESLPGRLVWHFHEDEKGLLWVSTQSGLGVLDRKTDLFQQYKHNPKDQYSLSSDNVKFVSQDLHGRIWVATEGGGLCMFNNKTNKFITYTVSDGLPSNTIYGILTDEKNCFWLSTKKGICTFHPDSMKFTNYYVSDGLQANSFNIQSYCKNNATNELLFGGPGGFTIFQPNNISQSRYNPQIYITSLKIGNQIVIPGIWKNKRKILTKTILETDTLRLKYNENSISLDFASLHFSAPENIQYQYKLEGFDTEWKPTDNKRNYAIYTNLSDGKYTFRLKATNCDGVLSSKEQTLYIQIAPPWWKTLWFRIIVLIVLIIAIGWGFIIRIASLEKAKIRLKKLVQIKTIELSEKNEKLSEQKEILENANTTLQEHQTQILEQTREIIEQRESLKYSNDILKNKNVEILGISKQLHEADQSKIRFFTNISHELRTPFSLILGPLESLIEKTQKNHQFNSRLQVIQNNAHRLLRLINQMLDFNKIDNNTIELKIENQDIISFIQHIFEAHSLIAEKKNIDFRITANHASYNTWFDPDKLDKILYNLLSNAFKFTPDNGSISLECNLNSVVKDGLEYDSLTLKIQDSGIGIGEDYLEKIFERFYQVDQSDSRQYEGSGIGLSLTKHLIELHHGTISVDSKLNEGTTFEVNLTIGEVLCNHSIDDFDKKEGSQGSTRNIVTSNSKNKGILKTSKPVVLIVEDNEELRNYLEEELSVNYEIIEAENGKKGLVLANEFLPDLIISDLMMPVMDGFEMCEIIKNEWLTSHIPIIMLTAKVDDNSNLQGLEIGADAYIRKPFQITHLKAQIENLLTNRKKLIKRLKASSSLENLVTKTDDIDDNFLKQIRKLIEKSISNPQFGVDTLASQMNMSRSKLYKKTYSILRISAGEIIRNIRLKRAAELLLDKNNSIADVALMIGFADHPQFTRSFTNQFGMSPKQFQLKKLN